MTCATHFDFFRVWHTLLLLFCPKRCFIFHTCQALVLYTHCQYCTYRSRTRRLARRSKRSEKAECAKLRCCENMQPVNLLLRVEHTHTTEGKPKPKTNGSAPLYTGKPNQKQKSIQESVQKSEPTLVFNMSVTPGNQTRCTSCLSTHLIGLSY